VKLTNNNGQEINKKLKKMVWRLGSLQEFQMSTQIKEKEEKQSNVQN